MFEAAEGGTCATHEKKPNIPCSFLLGEGEDNLDVRGGLSDLKLWLKLFKHDVLRFSEVNHWLELFVPSA